MESFVDKELDTALAELATERELFWRLRRRTLKRLPSEWRHAIERGEALLRDAQRLKIESKVSFSLL
jgi:hypothetical protein